jgi:Fe2+ transport system protein FeoA
MTTLDRLRPGVRGIVTTVRGEPALIQRLGEMGVFEGETIEVIGVAPLGDPLEIRIGDGRLSLRREEAAGIEIEEADAKRG